MAVNRDIFIRSLALLTCFFFFTAQGARLGDATLAANAVLITFLLILSNLLDGFANAAEALVGEAQGRQDHQAFADAVAATGRWTIGCALVGLLGFCLGGAPLIGLLTDLQSIRDTAIEYLPWVLLLPVTASAGFWLDGIFVGATRGTAMRNTMLASVGVFFMLWVCSRGWDNHGLWLTMNGFMAARGVFMAWVLWGRRRHHA
jgi:MATE family multidrug resistance protein